MELDGLQIIDGVDAGAGKFFIYDKDGEYLFSTLDREIAEEIVKRVNEYDCLKNNLECYRKLMANGLEAMTLLILKDKEE